MKKFKELFKDWFFWIAVIILSVVDMIRILSIYEFLSFALAIGIILGSFVFIIIFYQIIHSIYKLLKFINK